MKKQKFQKTKIAITALILSMCFTYASASWTDAPPNPPSNNVPAPINVGPDSQTKTGYFEVTKDTTGKPGTWAFSVPNGASWFKAVGAGLMSTKNIYLGALPGESSSIYFAPRNAGYESLDAMLMYSSSKGHLGFWDGLADGTSGSEVLTINNGKIGIGNTSPTERLTVNGNVRVSDWVVSGGLSASALQVTGGSPAVGKVLTSDGQGNATWQASAGSQTIRWDKWVEVKINGGSGGVKCNNGWIVTSTGHWNSSDDNESTVVRCTRVDPTFSNPAYTTYADGGSSVTTSADPYN